MYRTRIVRGTYIKISAKEHNMYSNENIITSASKEVTEVGKESGVTYNSPKTAPLNQTIKLIVQFRPKSNWKGEFGFDWIRIDDTKLFNDNKFEDIVGYQYEDAKFKTKVKDGNKYTGHFKKDETMFKSLLNQYKPYTVPWKTIKDKKTGNDVAVELYTPWLSIKKEQEIAITFLPKYMKRRIIWSLPKQIILPLLRIK